MFYADLRLTVVLTPFSLTNQPITGSTVLCSKPLYGKDAVTVSIQK
jgi:hypothetical protein